MRPSPGSPPPRATHAFLIITLLSSAIMALATGEPVTAATPTLDLQPGQGQPGTQVVVRGRQFPGNADGTLVWAADGSVLATFRTARNGRIQVPFVIPPVAAGAYSVVANVAGATAQATFQVDAPPTPTSTPAPPPTATDTPVPLPTDTPVPLPTDTPAPTATDPPAPTATNPSVPTPTNPSVPTATDTPTAVDPGEDELTFAPVADARVESANPGANFGADPLLGADTSPVSESYLRFDVRNVTGAVTKATLRLRGAGIEGAETPDGPAVYRAADGWTEATITWNTKPARTGGPFADAGAIAADAWVEYDLTALVVGDGSYTMVLVATSSNGVDLFAREGANPPQLVLDINRSGSPAPSPTAGPTATATATLPPNTGESILVGAGDIATCTNDYDEATAKLLDGIGGTVFTAGDNAYPDGTAADFANCYDPTWGRHKARTRPSAGNHEYHSSGGAPYFAYFGAAAGSPGAGYYSYDLGSWHVVVLNSNIDMSPGSQQERWLRADLAANPTDCTVAYWHHPRFSSGMHGSDQDVAPFWDALYEAGAEVVLVGHEHDYERFAPQDPSGVADPDQGIRQIVVGTGGKELRGFGTIRANSEARNSTTYGVLKLTLGDGSYSWQFVAAPGGSFTDAGSGTCHGPAGSQADSGGAATTTAPSTTATATATQAPTSSPTPSQTATPTGATGQTIVFAPAADARVAAAEPTTNFGASDYLAADGGATGDESFLRFEVSGLTGAVTRATLRLYAISDTPDGPAAYAATGGWTENGVTWNTKPALTSAPFGDTGAIPANSWVEFDVTVLVGGNGTFDFGLAQPGSDGVKLNSREAAASRPQLVVTTGASGAPAPTSTPTATPGGTLTPAPTGCATTIQALVDTAAPGSVVSVPSCVYRETVTITKPLTLDGGGGAEIRGSDVWDASWSQSGGYWTRGTVPGFSTGGECQAGTSRCLWPEQVFFDGRPLLQVAANPVSGQFSIDAARQVVLADNPSGHTVEVTTRRSWVDIRSSGVTVRGFTMRHAANPAQTGGIANGSFGSVTIAGNVLSDAHGAVVSIRDASGVQLLNNDISRGGQEGVHGTGLTDSLVQGNRIHDNNTEGFNPVWEAGGLKMTQLNGVTIYGNEAARNDGPGIWCDIDCTNVTISSNRVHHNYGSWGMGIVYEISHYGVIRDNAVWENGWDYTAWGWGAGIAVQNSDHTEVFGNVVAWNGDGISVVSQNRGGNWNNVVGNSIHDNVVVSTDGGPKALGWYQDWNGVLYAAGSNNLGANNAYWYPAAEGAGSRFEWNGGLRTVGEFNATPGEENGRYLSDAEMNAALAAAGIPATAE